MLVALKSIDGLTWVKIWLVLAELAEIWAIYGWLFMLPFYSEFSQQHPGNWWEVYLHIFNTAEHQVYPIHTAPILTARYTARIPNLDCTFTNSMPRYAEPLLLLNHIYLEPVLRLYFTYTACRLTGTVVKCNNAIKGSNNSYQKNTSKDCPCCNNYYGSLYSPALPLPSYPFGQCVPSRSRTSIAAINVLW